MANFMKHTVAILLMMSCMLSAYASEEGNTPVMNGFVNLNDSVAVYKALYDNTPIEPVFKLVPRFAIVGLDNRFVFSIGAGLKFTASFDWNNPVHNPRGLSIGAVQPAGMKDRNLYQMTAGGSGIYFNIIGFPNTANEIGLFISLGMDNECNNTYKIEAGQVYMRYQDWQVGFASSLYNDRGADAYTIDGSGPCASGSHATVGMNWQHFFNRHIRLGVGVELPNSSYTQIDPSANHIIQGSYTSSNTSNQSFPNFPFYVGYAWKGSHVRLSGLLKNVRYMDFTTGKGHSQMGFGVKLTGHVITQPLEWFWMAQYGYASASTFKGDKGLGLDLVPDDNCLGRLRPTQTWGLIAAAQWNITRKHLLTMQYSHMRNIIPYYSVGAETSFDDQIRYGSTFTVNGVWRITSLFSTGLEYRFVDKRNEGGDYISCNRVYLMFMMNF